MKSLLQIGLIVMIGLGSFAQKPQIKKGVYSKNYKKEQKITTEPFEKISVSTAASRRTVLKNSDKTNIVTVLNLGTSANAAGYSGGTRTMVWADDDLNVVANFHRMGPGSSPVGLSGYLSMDLGENTGKLQTDWTTQIQVYASNLPASPQFYDACISPSAAIYNPSGNTTLANAFLAYFAPNYANLVESGPGGYSYGTANLANHADTIKHLRWYNGHPFTYIPDGFTISKTGVAHMVDLDMNIESGIEIYQDSVIYGRGVWNAVTNDFDYTFKTLAFPCKGDASAADCKIAVSPDGNTVYISVLSNPDGATPLIDSTYFPVLRKSTDGGLTWSYPMVVQIDGPNGIAGIKYHYSDYFIEHLFAGPPYPTRDEIPYTTVFDHSISVDKWGRVHLGVAVGYAPGGYQITAGVDSLINVFDIYTCGDGAWVAGLFLGTLKTFRGTWSTYTCDNRVYTSRNKTGDKMFFTWNDTHIDGEMNNQNPDVFARGFDLITRRLTSDNGLDNPNNVTFLCGITQEAYWQCTSPIVFTDNNKFTIPICTQWFTDAAADVQFKYIPDFSFQQSDFTEYIGSDIQCPVGIEEREVDTPDLDIYPNPAKDIATVHLILKHKAEVSLLVTNLVGIRVMSVNKGEMDAGNFKFSLNFSSFTEGIYFITITAGDQKITRKIVVG